MVYTRAMASRSEYAVCLLVTAATFLAVGVAVGQEKKFEVGSGGIDVMAVSKDGSLIAIDDAVPGPKGEAIVVFDVTKKEKIIFRENSRFSVPAMVFSDDGKTLISYSGKIVKFRSVPSGEMTKTLAFDGKQVLLTNRYLVFSREEQNKLAVVLDLGTGKEIGQTSEHG